MTQTSVALMKAREEIEKKWAAAVKQQISAANGLEDPILFNYFPRLLKRLAETLDPDSERSDALKGNTSAQEHGGERARLTNFNISQIATEFYLLKDAIRSVLSSKVSVTQEEWLIIDRSIDQSLQESISSFALAETYLREQFIAMLAHDIRGPVAFMRMATSLLMEGVEPNVAHELYQRMADAADNAAALIDNILDASMIKASRRIKLGIQHCRIHDIVHKVMRSYQQDIRLEGPNLEGYWCPNGLTRSLHNLIENALKYGDSTRPILITTEEGHGAMTLSVHNEGEPIPIEEQETIFQPFHRTQQAEGQDVKGWGFGLPIVRGIAEAHGGTIEVDSTKALGTTLSLTLPLDARPFQNALTLE
jgi:signal transduction histidine kinase